MWSSSLNEWLLHYIQKRFDTCVSWNSSSSDSLLKTIRIWLWGLMIISSEKLVPILNKINLNSVSTQGTKEKKWTNDESALNSHTKFPKFLMPLLKNLRSKSNWLHLTKNSKTAVTPKLEINNILSFVLFEGSSFIVTWIWLPW